MTLRDPDKYRDAAWDWGIFTRCWDGTRIRPSDIDFIVAEADSKEVLILECKPAWDALRTGQRLALEIIAAKPLFTVYVVIGPRNVPIQYVRVPQWADIRDTNLEDMQDRLHAWFRGAYWGENRKFSANKKENDILLPNGDTVERSP